MKNINEKDPIWKKNGTQFVDSVSKLLERLLDYRSVMQVRNSHMMMFNEYKDGILDAFLMFYLKGTLHWTYDD